MYPNRVMHIIETTGPGGAESVFLALVKGMANKGFASVPCITGPGWVYDNLVGQGFSPQIIPTNRKFDIIYLAKLILYAKRANINLIHSHLLGANLYSSLAGRTLGIPVLTTFHGSVDKGTHQGQFIWLKMFLIFLCSDRVVAVSNKLRKEICQKGLPGKAKCVVVHNGIDLAKFNCHHERSSKKLLGFKESDLLIGAIGNIRPAKGYKYLIKSALIVKKHLPNAKYLIVGEAPDKEKRSLERYSHSLGLEDNVHFLGFRTDISEIMNCLDLFVISSISEGFSIVTLEALAAGVPVVATRSGGPEEILTDGQDGLLVPPRDPEALSGATLRVLWDKDYATFLSSNGRHTAKKFSLSYMLENYEKIYLDILKKG